jgi:hypothetical protein
MTISAANGFAIGDTTNDGEIQAHVEDVYLGANNAVGVARGAASLTTSVRANRILESGSPTGTVGVSCTSGEIDIIANSIDADSALSTGASGTIRGQVSEVNGTIVKTGDLRVQYGEAAPILGTANPNGSVVGFNGQIFTDTVGGVSYKCESDPTGTVWSVI